MNHKTVLIGMFAIFAAVLIFDLPIVGAIQINILRSPTWTKWDDADIFPENYVNKQVSKERIGGGLFWTNANIIMDIGNTTTPANIEKVYVYKCSGMGPDDCADSVTPEAHDVVNNQLYVEIEWSGNSEIVTSCLSSPNSCEEFMHVFLLYKVNDNGKIVWFGDWSKIERRAHDFPSPYFYENRLDEVDLRTDSGWLVQSRDFVLEFLKIPFNPTWVSGAVFHNANYLYELSASSSSLQSSPSFQTTKHTGDQIDSISQDYSFVFAETSSGIMSPVTLYLNPSFTCGSYGCETDKSETTANCCYDCGCNEGYYCDGGIEGVCKSESAITLNLYGTQQTSITNCNQQHVINITVQVNYPPSDMTITGSEYRLEGTAYSTNYEEITANIYRCPVTVPPMPDCQEGEYTIGPNYIDFSISYSDGPGSASKDLSVQFPDITVGSYECGQNGCESGLGENSVNCCYDCGCETGYCDIETGAQPNTGTCKADITASNLFVTAKPTHFYTHNPGSGDRVDIIMQISNAPSSLDVVSTICEMDCAEGCNVSCQVSCSEISSSDPNIYNSSCLMTFWITDYDPATDYSLYPNMNITVTYNNGSFGQIAKVFSEDMSTISIGSTWCGDGICSETENLLNCCYDCHCPEGEYCDTKIAGSPSEGDSCKSEGDIEFIVDGLEWTTFDNYYKTHYTKLMAHVNNPPSSLNGTASCSFADGNEIYCYMDCERFGDEETTHILDCNITIPVIDYKTSSFYNPGSRRIVIGPNTMNYSVVYNNGSGMVSMELSDSFPDITINVKSRCGTGPGYIGTEEHCMPYDRDEACEENLGESSNTCCCDCPCPEDQYCKIDNVYDFGECRSIEEIVMIVDRFEPTTVECQIGKDTGVRNMCIFSEQLNIDVHIEPEANYTIVSSSYKMDDEENYLICRIGTDEAPFNRYNCSIPLRPITSEGILHETTIDKQVDFSLNIQSGGFLETTLTDSGNFKVKMVDSDTIKSLEEQIQDLEKSKNGWNNIKWALIVILAAAALFCLAACIWSLGIGCGDCWIVYACLATVLLPTLIWVLGKIDENKIQITAMHNAMNPGDLHEVEIDNSKFWLGLISGLAAIACAIGLASGIGSKEGKLVSTAVPAAREISDILENVPDTFENRVFDMGDVGAHDDGTYDATPWYVGPNGNGYPNGDNGYYNGDKKKTCGELEVEKGTKPVCHCCDESGFDTGASCSGKKKPGDKCGLGASRGKCKEGMCKYS